MGCLFTYKGKVYKEAEFRELLEGLPSGEAARFIPGVRAVMEAPFASDWHEMAMKRMIRYAAEHGYEKLGWITGDQTAERYDLSKQIKTLEYYPDQQRLVARSAHDGHTVINESGIAPEQLEKYVGKEPARKLLEAKVQEDVGVGKFQQLSNADLKVGGEWANNLYDKAIPNFLSKYGKKWGAKVGETSIEAGYELEPKYRGPEKTLPGVEDVYRRDDAPNVTVKYQLAEVIADMKNGVSYRDAMSKQSIALAEFMGGNRDTLPVTAKVHALDVTPEMKKSVMDGQPLFQEKKGATEFLNDGKAIVYLFKNADASTFLHEFVHTLEPYLKSDDRATIDKWLDDAGFEGARDRKEALARAFENFHMDGEAPTAEVKGIFQRIQEVMRQIYESVIKSPLVQPSDEVNDLFKRWYGFGAEDRAERQFESSMFDSSEPPPPLPPSDLVTSSLGQDLLPPPPVQPGPKPGQLAPPPVQLNSYVVPGLSEFYKQDVEPFVQKTGGGFASVLDGIRKVLAPRAFVPREALDEIMRLKGDQAKAQFLTEQTMRGVKNMFDRASQDENVDFMDRLKSGREQKTAELTLLADFYRKTDDATYQAVKEFKPSLPYKENHFRIFWKTLPMGEEEFNQGKMFEDQQQQPQNKFVRFFSRRPLQGTKGFMKQATLDDVSAGIERGGIPVSYNPQTLFELGQADAMKFITAQRMFQSMKQIPGMAQFIGVAERVPDGMAELNDKIAKVYFKPESGEGMVEGGRWVLQADVARALNNYLSRDYIRENPLGQGLMFAKNFGTALELSVSPFHAVFESIEAMGSQFGIGAMRAWNLGVRELDPGQIVKGVVEMVRSPLAPYEAARLGGNMLKYVRSDFLRENPDMAAMTNKGGYLRPLNSAKDFLQTAGGQKFIKQYPDAARLVGDLFSGGPKLAMHEDYRIDTASTFLENFNSNNYIGATLRALPALNSMIMKPLFDNYIPKLKVGMWMKEYSEQLLEYKDDLDAGRMTRAELSRQVWDRVENRFGEMNFDNLFWNRTFKSALQLSFRSVTWKLGNLRAGTQAIGGQLSDFADPLKMLAEMPKGGDFEGKRLVPKLDPNMAWLFGVAVTTAVIGTITQYAMTGKMPENLADITHPQSGGTDDRGKPNRISLPTYYRDYEHLQSAPGNYVKGSLATMWTKVPEIWNNKDFYGRQVYDPTDPIWKKTFDGMAHTFNWPLSITNYERVKESSGGQTAAILSYLGFTKAPNDIDMSDAEVVAKNIQSDKMSGLPGRDKQQQARADARTEVLRMMRRNDPEAYSKMLEYMQGGKLTNKDVGTIRKRASESWLQTTIDGFSAPDAMKVWSKADPEERNLLINQMVLKIRRSQTLSPTEKQQYMNQVLQDMNSTPKLQPPPGQRLQPFPGSTP